MKIYIDAEYKCHVADDGIMREFDVPFFDDKCTEFIEGHRYVPDGEVWIGEDGTAFQGEQITPWIDSTKLRIAQLEYELEDADAALREVGVFNG